MDIFLNNHNITQAIENPGRIGNSIALIHNLKKYGFSDLKVNRIL